MGFETKYVAPRRKGTALLARLRAVCRVDPDHPVNRVHSVYFDDLDGGALDAVENGDYHKHKLRLRWYETAGQPIEPAYLESKRKLGARRGKQRLGVADFRADERPLHDPTWLRLPQRLAAAGIPRDPGALQPALHLAYRRRRFVEPLTGMRVALDDDIRIVRIHPRLGPLTPAARLPHAQLVLEVKGDDRELPPTLGFVFALGARRRAFSKYGVCRAALASPAPLP